MRSLVLPLSALASLASLASLGAQAPTHMSPAGAAKGPGNINNTIPFRGQTASSIHYQQIHDASSWSNNSATLFRRLRFRAKGNRNTTGTIDVEIYMAQSPNSAANASATFANNVAAGTEINVFKRKKVNLPAVAGGVWGAGDFAFDNPFAFVPTKHLSWRMVIWSNNTATYTLDAFSDWRFGQNTPYQGCQHPNATRKARHSATYRSPGNVWDMNGWSWLAKTIPAVLLIGGSNTNWSGLTLPFDMTVAGAPGCQIVNDGPITRQTNTRPIASGFAQIKINTPANPSLIGKTIFSQYAFLDAGANPLGVFTSGGEVNRNIPAPNGVTRVFALNQPKATKGTLGIEFSVPVGLN